MMATAPAPNGPRLTLVVNRAHLARANASQRALLSPKKTHPHPILHSPKRTQHQSPKYFGAGSPGPAQPDYPTEERPDRVFHILDSKGQTQALHADISPPLTPPHEREPSAGQRHMTDKIQKYLDGLAEAQAADPDDEPPQGNRNPHPQLVAPERSEHYLVKALKMNQDAQRDLYEENRLALEAKIRELEKTVAEKDDRIKQLTAQAAKAPAQPTARPSLSDADVAAWYESRSGSWSAWVDEFAHEDTDRVTGLHPLQMQELRNGVRNFVRLTDDGNLPAPIFTPGKVSPFNTTRLLLYGLLNDFIVREILESPFWVFSAISKHAFDVESPMIPAPSSAPYKTPAAIHLDTTTGWSTSGLPPLISPFNIPPAPTTARSLELLSPSQGPPLAQKSAIGLATRGLSLQYNIPSKQDMQDLETLLVRTQHKDGEANTWRAQMMKILSDGGLSRDLCHRSMANNEDKQMLANARREYARELKDQFLSSAARFFLRDQDPQGISILESRLISELDFALRFSAQAWARPTPLSFIGLKQLNAAPLRGSGVGDDVVDFFPSSSQQARARGERQQVVVVLRPAVGTLRKIGGPGKVWVKAQSIASSVSMSPSLIDLDHEESYSETSMGTPSLSSLSTPSLTSSQQTSTTPKSAASNVMLPNRGLSLRERF